MISPVLQHEAFSGYVLSALKHFTRGVEEAEAGGFAPFLPMDVNVQAAGQPCREGQCYTGS